ncbi:MAG: mevalonate kinase [bacterium]|nr:mevalonate kinase [bacterium]
MKPITVSAPGKIHLMGEHAVVYGKPALLAAIDRRCKVSLMPRGDRNIQIISKDTGLDVTLSLDEVLEKTYHAQKQWEDFLEKKDAQILKAITKDPADYLSIAVGETLIYFGMPPESGFTITVSSDIPMGAGLGSSAALAAAVASAIMTFLGKKLDMWTIHEIALLIEQKRHGNPSGGDTAIVSSGNLIWFRKESEVLKVVQRVPFGILDPIASRFFLVDTGIPEESTGEMVQAVRDLYDEKIEFVANVFNDLEKVTRDMVIVLKNNHEGDLIEIIRQGEKHLEQLEVVSDEVKEVIRSIEGSGGAAKISGGGGKLKGTGHLLVYHKDKKTLEDVLAKFNLMPVAIRLGASGLTVH